MRRRTFMRDIIPEIKTEEAYEKALSYIYSLLDSKAESPEAYELKVWSEAVEKYEEINYPIP